MNLLQTPYHSTYQFYKNTFSLNESYYEIKDQGIEIHNMLFDSNSDLIFPGGHEYYTPDIERIHCGGASIEERLYHGDIQKLLKISDSEVVENRSFRYIFLRRKKAEKSTGILFMFHGLNEKDWTKYLPWAQRLVELSGKDVILFPLAFHINRALEEWSNSRMMQKVSLERQNIFPGLQESSFTNAASSTRLHFVPSRFFLSGLETYNDVIQLATKIRMGNHPLIDRNAGIDFFGYSAGAFLSQILMMANRNGIFSKSKGIFFCGGTTLDRMRLTSKYIMDSEAHQAINRFYIDQLDENLEKDSFLNLLFSAATSGGLYFRTMLSEKDEIANKTRESRLRELNSQMMAFSLKNDAVMLPSDIEATLKGVGKDISIPCKVYDFDYEYSHVNPFPALEKIETQVESAFSEVFEAMAHFLLK